jgi:glyoxylase-like metal-dependent hydrolase (beta-lactamase superfamily II)/ferredoxin
MANRQRALQENVAGNFFVDSTCINCGVSRHYAPEVFGDTGDYAFVKKQPQTEAEMLAAQQALLACPVGSIGLRKRVDLQAAINSFPLRMADSVYLNGFNHRNSYGAHSYFIASSHGNWLIDSPRFTAQLVRSFEARGGIEYIFLTHADDVADAHRYAQHFKAQRIIHRLEAHAQPDAEMILDDESEQLIGAARIVFTPGHTRGHCVLLWDDKYLFTGDHFAWLAERGRFGSFRDACWYSWTVQIGSVQKLALFDNVEWIFPGHGKWAPVAKGKFPAIVREAVRRMRGARR